MTTLRQTDVILVAVTLFLVAIGLAMVYNTSAVLAQERYGDSLFFFKHQVVWAILGLLAMWAARCVPYRVQQRLVLPLVMVTLCALIAVLVPAIGKQVGGARRWFDLGLVSVQPSEFAKYILLIYLASLLAKQQDTLHRSASGYLPHMLMLGLFCVLIFFQPDLGTAVGLVATAGLLLLVAGMPLRYVGYASIVALPLLYWGLFHVNFRWDRLKIFLDPWVDAQGAGYQPVQSLYALGQGGVFGTGLGQSQQKLFFLPEAHTDFIFAIFGEEFGFIGAVALIGLFLVLLWRILRIALDCPTPFGAFLGLGIFFGLTIQVLMNLGVVVVLLPTKGLPLPFISLGGSNLFMSLVAVGTMLNIAQDTS